MCEINKLDNIILQYSLGLYSAVQYSTGQYSKVHYTTLQYSKGHYTTVQYSIVQCAISDERLTPASPN